MSGPIDHWIREQAGRRQSADTDAVPARPGRADAGAGVRRPEPRLSPQERANAWLRDAIDRARIWR